MKEILLVGGSADGRRMSVKDDLRRLYVPIIQGASRYRLTDENIEREIPQVSQEIYEAWPFTGTGKRFEIFAPSMLGRHDVLAALIKGYRPDGAKTGKAISEYRNNSRFHAFVHTLLQMHDDGFDIETAQLAIDLARELKRP